MEWTIVTAILGSVAIVVGGIIKIFSNRYDIESQENRISLLESDLGMQKQVLNDYVRSIDARVVRLEANYQSLGDKIEQVRKSIERLEADIHKELLAISSLIADAIKKSDGK